MGVFEACDLGTLHGPFLLLCLAGSLGEEAQSPLLPDPDLWTRGPHTCSCSCPHQGAPSRLVGLRLFSLTHGGGSKSAASAAPSKATASAHKRQEETPSISLCFILPPLFPGVGTEEG